MNQLHDMQQQAFNDYSRFVVLTGRRRVGKTSLVYRLMEDTKEQAPGLYFFVGRKTEATLLRTFCEEVHTKLGEYVPEGITTFRGLMQLLLEIAKRRKFTLFIDEFQEFDNVNAGVFSDIQELWDRYKKDTNVCLIVSDDGEDFQGRGAASVRTRRLHDSSAAFYHGYDARDIK